MVMISLFRGKISAAEFAIYTEESPPANYLRDGELTGVCAEIVMEIQSRLGDDTPIEVLPWRRAYGYATTRPNVMIFSLTRTPERESLFSWVGPLLIIEWTLYGRMDRKFEIHSIDDARRVGAIGTYSEDAREKYLQSLGFDNLESVRNNQLNVLKLMAGRIDLFVSSNLGIDAMMKEAGYSVTQVRSVLVLETRELHMGFSKGTDGEIVRDWQDQFNAMREDGTYARIYEKWFPNNHTHIHENKSP